MQSPVRKPWKPCVVGALVGFVLGALLSISQVAMAQAVPVPVTTTPAELDLLFKLFGVGGLPLAGLWVGWWVPHATNRLLDNLVIKTVAELKTWEPVVTIKMATDEDTQMIRLQKRIEELEAAPK